MVQIRPMKKEEAGEVRKIGRKIFEPFEGIFIPMPKACFVALEGDEIVGAVLYKHLAIQDKKITYVDFIFVKKNVSSKGIGKKLLETCMEQGIKEGCHGFSGIIRDDNVSSWKMFIDKGYQKVQALDLLKNFGIKGMVSHLMKTPLPFATGMAYYLKMNQGPMDLNGERTFNQIFKYLFMSLLTLVPLLLWGLKSGLYIISALIVMLSCRGIGGYLFTILTKEKWTFKCIEGGFMIPFLASFVSGIFFICGNWYPKIYRKGRGFKRSLGLSSLGQWFALFMILITHHFILKDHKFMEVLSSLAALMMILSVIPLYPLASFGGKRLYDWDKIIYGLILVASFIILVFFS